MITDETTTTIIILCYSTREKEGIYHVLVLQLRFVVCRFVKGELLRSNQTTAIIFEKLTFKLIKLYFSKLCTPGRLLGLEFDLIRFDERRRPGELHSP